MNWKKYDSRKFIVTVLVGGATFILAAMGKMTADTALVFSAVVASYNVMQGMIDKGDK